jgi:hypothetical protein
MKPSFPFDKSGREIKFDEATNWVDTYRKACEKDPNPVFGEAFSKDVLLKILTDDNCHGIRIYHGQTNGEPRLLLVGIDKRGNDMSRGSLRPKDMPTDDGGSGIYGDGARCPSECGDN